MRKVVRVWQNHLSHLGGLLLFGMTAAGLAGLAALALPDYLPTVSDASFVDVFVDAAGFYTFYVLFLWAIASVFVIWTYRQIITKESRERLEWSKICDDSHAPSLIVLIVSFAIFVGYTEGHANQLAATPFLTSTHLKFAPPLGLYFITELFMTAKVVVSGGSLKKRERDGLPNTWEARRDIVIPSISLISIIWILLIFRMESIHPATSFLTSLWIRVMPLVIVLPLVFASLSFEGREKPTSNRRVARRDGSGWISALALIIAPICVYLLYTNPEGNRALFHTLQATSWIALSVILALYWKVRGGLK